MNSEYIFINFDDSWKYGVYNINNEEKSILEKGFKFYYNEETSMKELFLYFNKLFYNLNQKQNEIPYNKINDNSSLKYFYRLVYKNDLIFIFDLKMKVKEIIENLNLKKFTILLTIFIEKGATIKRINGMRFYFNSREDGKHKLPHIHVKYNEYEIIISLDGKFSEGHLPKKQLKIAKEIIEKDKKSFLLKWNNLTDGMKFYFKNNELIRAF